MNVKANHQDLSISCPIGDYGALIGRIELYKVHVTWELSDGAWDLGAWDDGTHFHVFCADGHETKLWGRELPERLQTVVYPGEA